jgi:adhesin/invasin
MNIIKLTVGLGVSAVVSVGYCQNNASFSASSTNAINYNSGSIAAGDFNADDKTDFVFVNPYSGYTPFTNSHTAGTIAVGLGNGDGTFRSLSNYPIASVEDAFSSGLRRVATADLNHDGLTDVLVTYGYEWGRVAVFTATNGGALVRRADVTASRYCETLDFGDFDGDGNLDFVVSGYAGPFVTIHFGDGSGAFPRATNLVASMIADCAAAGDVNRDGRPDVLVGSYKDDSTSLVIFLNGGNGTFSTATNLSLLQDGYAMARSITLADFNEDGFPDATVGFEDLRVLTVVLQRDGAFSILTNYTLNAGAPYSATADFDGDGFSDLVAGADLLFGKGTGEFIPPELTEMDDDRYHFAVADVNRDGRPDILRSNASVLCYTNSTRPSLRIQKTNNEARISWPAWNGFSLEATPDLNPGSGWSAVSTGVFGDNGRKVFVDPFGASARVFRLRFN